MSIDLGLRVTKCNYADPFEAYSGVTLTTPDGKSFTSGNESGRTITVESLWASQKAADNLLALVKGVRHQPFSATGAVLDPSAEIGDAVTVDGITGTIFSQSQRFGSQYRADISSPGDEEVNHEIPYYSPIQRTVARVGSVARGAAAAAEQAQKDILRERKNLIAALNREDGAPEDLLAGFDSYVRWDLKNNEGFASSVLFAQIGETAKAEIGVYVVEADGQTKTFATILADQIALESAVEDAFVELDQKAEKSTVEELDGKVKTILSAQADLTTRVGDAESALSLKAEQSTVEELDESLKTLYTGHANLTTRVGNAESSLLQKVSVAEFDEAIAAEQEAITELSSSVDGVKASLTLKAAQADVDALSGSMATLQADVIKLEGRVDLSGNVSVSDGQLTVLGNLVAAQSLQVGQNSFYIAGAKYSPTTITSTTGDRTVLGY